MVSGPSLARTRPNISDVGPDLGSIRCPFQHPSAQHPFTRFTENSEFCILTPGPGPEAPNKQNPAQKGRMESLDFRKACRRICPRTSRPRWGTTSAILRVPKWKGSVLGLGPSMSPKHVSLQVRGHRCHQTVPIYLVWGHRCRQTQITKPVNLQGLGPPMSPSPTHVVLYFYNSVLYHTI
jgi:hypothetical protein